MTVRGAVVPDLESLSHDPKLWLSLLRCLVSPLFKVVNDRTGRKRKKHFGIQHVRSEHDIPRCGFQMIEPVTYVVTHLFEPPMDSVDDILVAVKSMKRTVRNDMC